MTLRSNGSKGQIWFENGTVRHAEAGSDKGEAAFYEMVRWTDGSFVIEHGVQTRRRIIERDAMFLVMEGVRLISSLEGLIRDVQAGEAVYISMDGELHMRQCAEETELRLADHLQHRRA